MDCISQAWPGWEAGDLIGEGAFGRVYSASNAEGGVTTRAAVKVIDIPRDEAEAASLRSMGYDAEAIRAYFEDEARSLLGEIALMDALKGAPHVVHVEDHALVEGADGEGWAVLIRMELLEPLADVFRREGPPSPRLAARIAADVADALARCHALGILHRDVKPGNVFRSPFGEYKLGDFGIARRISGTARSARTVAGTEDYMAPEVLCGRYDGRADTYSLGVMLYRWLNGGRPPFVAPSGAPSRADIERAGLRRMAGERPPAPAGAGVDPALAAIALRAVEPDPAGRWQSAAEMRDALERWLDGEAAETAPGRGAHTVAIPPEGARPEEGPARGGGGTVRVLPREWDAPRPSRGADARATVAVPASRAAAGCRAGAGYLLPGTGARRTVYVDVPAGTTDGASFRLAGLGAPGANGGPAGDLVVTVRVEPDPQPAPAPAPAPEPAPRHAMTRRALLAAAAGGATALAAGAAFSLLGGGGGSGGEFVSTETATTNSAVDSDVAQVDPSDLARPYNAVLDDKKSDSAVIHSLVSLKYGLADMNGDSLPELIVMSEYDIEDCHADIYRYIQSPYYADCLGYLSYKKYSLFITTEGYLHYEENNTSTSEVEFYAYVKNGHLIREKDDGALHGAFYVIDSYDIDDRSAIDAL